VCRHDTKAYLVEQCKETERLHWIGDSKSMYAEVKLPRKPGAKTNVIKDKEGRIH